MTIFGLGLDLVKISRVEQVFATFGQRFLKRCFLNTEIESAYKRYRPIYALAKAIAAKEAFVKATGNGFKGLKMNEIELRHELSGKPMLYLHGRASIWVRSEKIVACHLNITDDTDYAIAVVILER